MQSHIKFEWLLWIHQTEIWINFDILVSYEACSICDYWIIVHNPLYELSLSVHYYCHSISRFVAISIELFVPEFATGIVSYIIDPELFISYMLFIITNSNSSAAISDCDIIHMENKFLIKRNFLKNCKKGQWIRTCLYQFFPIENVII